MTGNKTACIHTIQDHTIRYDTIEYHTIQYALAKVRNHVREVGIEEIDDLLIGFHCIEYAPGHKHRHRK